MYFTLYLQDVQFRWNLRAGNHEIIASGESYHHKSDCLHAVSLVNGKNGFPVRDDTGPDMLTLRGLARSALKPEDAPGLSSLGGLLNAASIPKEAPGLSSLGGLIDPVSTISPGLIAGALGIKPVR